MNRNHLPKIVPVIIGVSTVLAIVNTKRYPRNRQRINFIKQLNEQMIRSPYQSALLFEKRIEQTFKLVNQKVDSIYHFACQLEELIEQIKLE